MAPTTNLLPCTPRAVGTCGEHCQPGEDEHTHCAACWGAVLPDMDACLWCGAETAPRDTHRHTRELAERQCAAALERADRADYNVRTYEDAAARLEAMAAARSPHSPLAQRWQRDARANRAAASVCRIARDTAERAAQDWSDIARANARGRNPHAPAHTDY